MNKKQRRLYKALETIACATLTLEDAQGVADELSKEEVQEVIKKIESTFTDFDEDSLNDDIYNYGGYGHAIMAEVVAKIND